MNKAKYIKFKKERKVRVELGKNNNRQMKENTSKRREVDRSMT